MDRGTNLLRSVLDELSFLINVGVCRLSSGLDPCVVVMVGGKPAICVEFRWLREFWSMCCTWAIGDLRSVL